MSGNDAAFSTAEAFSFEKHSMLIEIASPKMFDLLFLTLSSLK